MSITSLKALLYSLALLLPSLAHCTPSPSHSSDDTNTARYATFFSNYCSICHGDQIQQGGLSLSHITDSYLDPEKLEMWRMIDHRLRFLDMPPKHAKQPSTTERKQVLAWIRNGLLKAQHPGAAINPRLQLPEFGNYVDHDALFNSPAGPVIPGPARLWRVRPGMYEAELARISQAADSPQPYSQPYSMRGKPEIKDYASLYFVDEPATDLLLRNAELAVKQQSTQRHYGAVFEALQAGAAPNRQVMTRAINAQFEFALHRTASAAETKRLLTLWHKNLATSGHPVGSQATLMAILMQPEVLFRSELGAGEADAQGRYRLSPTEIAQAINYALRNTFDKTLWMTAQQGKLTTKPQITAQLERLLDAPNADNPRLLQFFREYFNYTRATEIFKDALEQGDHDAQRLVDDLDFLIAYILDEDKDVLKQLLTTNKAFVNWQVDAHGKAMPARREIGVETVYGLPVDWKWTDQQPIKLPADQRAGVLTHPAWLAAWSGNFDNDPIRRGKWVRTHLLGGSVPDVPIGVDARIPQAEHLTLRQRLGLATEKPQCWRCHQRMNPLGLPFEQYSHYGYFRRNESLNGQFKPVNTHGRIDRTADANLNGKTITNPIQMMNILAQSKHVEQVFVRYAFRFFLGRNETLGDAATLQNAWQAYRDGDHRGGGGSFKALVRSLLTSESFLYRRK